MFVVYLAWICGNSAIALSCHANEAQHVHCCKSCECHHENCEKVHFESPHACNHDHSNTIALYDTTKRNTSEIKPFVLILSALISDITSLKERDFVDLTEYCERKVPIPITPTLSESGLRAPPVIA